MFAKFELKKQGFVQAVVVILLLPRRCCGINLRRRHLIKDQCAVIALKVVVFEVPDRGVHVLFFSTQI